MKRVTLLLPSLLLFKLLLVTRLQAVVTLMQMLAAGFSRLSGCCSETLTSQTDPSLIGSFRQILRGPATELVE